MKTKKMITAVVVILSLAALLVACGSGGGSGDVGGGDEDLPPSVELRAAAQPVSGSPAGTSQTFTILFNKSMQTATLALDGTAGAAVGSWTTTVKSNDTLTRRTSLLATGRAM